MSLLSPLGVICLCALSACIGFIVGLGWPESEPPRAADHLPRYMRRKGRHR